MTASPLADQHSSEGAVLAEYDGCILPQRFSTLEREYRAARETVALFDTNWHAILHLTGRDRIQYLHAISSQDIKSLPQGQGTLALLLNPQGRILAELEVYALPESLLVLSHRFLREQTIATLKKYVIASQVRIEDRTEKMGSCAVEGPRAAAVVEHVCGQGLADLGDRTIHNMSVGGIPCQLLRRSYFGESGAEFLATRDALPGLWQTLLAAVRAQGGESAGMDAFHALRIEHGVPWFPADFNDAMIPHEAALEDTHISFNKGCYTGQEIVERVRSRGHVNRKRVLLRFSTFEPPPPGTKLLAAGAEVGFVTSAAFSPKENTAIGMGYLRREYLAPGSIVQFDGGTAEVTL